MAVRGTFALEGYIYCKENILKVVNKNKILVTYFTYRLWSCWTTYILLYLELGGVAIQLLVRKLTLFACCRALYWNSVIMRISNLVPDVKPNNPVSVSQAYQMSNKSVSQLSLLSSTLVCDDWELRVYRMARALIFDRSFIVTGVQSCFFFRVSKIWMCKNIRKYFKENDEFFEFTRHVSTELLSHLQSKLNNK